MKHALKSGIISDVCEGNFSSHKNYTVESLFSLRKFYDGKSELHRTTKYDGFVIAFAHSYENVGFMSAFMQSVPKLTYDFMGKAEQLQTGLLGSAEHATVYLTYWYDEALFTYWWDITKAGFCNPAIPLVENTNATGEDDDCDFMIAASIVQHDDERTLIADVTEEVRKCMGPKHDFYGKKKDVKMAVIEYATQVTSTLSVRALLTANKPCDLVLFNSDDSEMVF